MELFKNIELETIDRVSHIRLNRSEKRNALNEELIDELLNAYQLLKEDKPTEIIHLSGNGKTFCAGADLEWMKSAAQMSYEENLKGSKKLAELFNTIYSFPKPTVAEVHGSAFGGAIGLMACHDFVIVEEDSKFAFSEVKLGLIPATIAPYVLKRIGQYKAVDLMLTGRIFTAAEAEKIGLVNRVVKRNELNETVEDLLKLLKLTAPEARASCKKLLHTISGKEITPEIIEYTAEEIAKHRSSDEGREGMNAFFENRDPNWIKD